MRLRRDDGFGLVELLMAMTILNVAILAVVAAFSSGMVSLRRAGKLATAAAIADTQMELYRGLTYDAIYLDTTSYNGADATYKGDLALSGSPAPTPVTAACAGVPPACNPSRSVTGPDRRSYRVDSYIVSDVVKNQSGTAISRTQKRVTVVVRDGANVAGPALARVTSTFDCATGQTATQSVSCPTS